MSTLKLKTWQISFSSHWCKDTLNTKLQESRNAHWFATIQVRQHLSNEKKTFVLSSVCIIISPKFRPVRENTNLQTASERLFGYIFVCKRARVCKSAHFTCRISPLLQRRLFIREMRAAAWLYCYYHLLYFIYMNLFGAVLYKDSGFSNLNLFARKKKFVVTQINWG